jgi:hypothetical protein
MAVHARYPAHAFPHDPRAIARFVSRSVLFFLSRAHALPSSYLSVALKPPPRRLHSSSVACVVSCVFHSSPALDTATGASAFLGEQGCGGHQLAAAVAGNTAFSDITCNNNDSGSPGPRKRARVGDVAGAGLTMDLEGQRALLPPVPLSVVPQAFRPVLCSGAASTSGRPAGPAPVSLGVLSHLYSNGVEIDALVRIEVRRPVSSHGSVANAVSFPFGRSGNVSSREVIRCLIPFSVLVTGFCAGRPSGCGRGCRSCGAGTRRSWCRPRNARRRGACGRRRPTWGARWHATRS